MKESEISKCQEEYYAFKPELDRFRESVLLQIDKILEVENIALGFPIQNRIKTWDSISEKLKNGRYTVKKTIKEMQDLIGFRIILLFNRDVEVVCKLLNANLNVIKQYDTSEKLKDDQFGYSSVHFIVSIPEDWLNVPTLKGLDEYVCEVQIRTLSQHTWAEASKELQYKNEENIPRPLLRSIGRVSALLETVDLEFERLLEQREIYKNNLDSELLAMPNQPLNVDILEAILDKNLPGNNKDKDEKYSQLLDELKILGVDDVNKLENIIQSQLTFALSEEKNVFEKVIAQEQNRSTTTRRYITDKERIARGVFYTHCGLMRTMLGKEYPKEWSQVASKKRKNK